MASVKSMMHMRWMVGLALALLVCLHAVDAAVPPGTDYSALNQGDPEKSYRERVFRAYKPVEEQVQKLKTGISSYLENPTGIAFAAGEKVTITVTGGEGQELRLIVHEFDDANEKWFDITRPSLAGVQKTKINPLPTHTEYELQEGENELIICNRGLGYLHYRSATPQEAPGVRIKIEGGKINGVLTPADDADTSRRLLEAAVYPAMDLLGERAQLIFPVEGLRKGCGETGTRELIGVYDRILTLIEDDLLGWGRYRAHTGGHVLVRVIADGFLCAGEMGVFFPKWAFPGVANAREVEKSSWGPAHELGHQLQTRPGMMWIGMVEVTNNIASMYVNYKFAPQRLRLETSPAGNARGERMRGGIFDCFVNNAITHRRLWQFQGGALPNGLPNSWEDTARDVFVDVAPLWQLLLYNHEVRGQKDFYPQIYEDVRRTDETALTQGELRVLFCKRACDAAGLDLSEFFVKTGILAPIDRVVSDYEEAHMTITRDMCLETMAYAHRYPKPESSVLYYLTGKSLHIYRDKLAIQQPPPGYALPAIENERLEIPAEAWQNAVAFEAYRGDELLHISLLGLNRADGKSGTTVICPEGTDSVKAVQWDGTRYNVLGDSPAPAEAPTESWLTRSNATYSLHEAARDGNETALQARISGPVARHNQYGQFEKWEPLTENNKPDLNTRNEQGKTALDLAREAGRPNIIRLLEEALQEKKSD